MSASVIAHHSVVRFIVIMTIIMRMSGVVHGQSVPPWIYVQDRDVAIDGNFDDWEDNDPCRVYHSPSGHVRNIFVAENATHFFYQFELNGPLLRADDYQFAYKFGVEDVHVNLWCDTSGGRRVEWGSGSGELPFSHAELAYSVSSDDTKFEVSVPRNRIENFDYMTDWYLFNTIEAWTHDHITDEVAFHEDIGDLVSSDIPIISNVTAQVDIDTPFVSTGGTFVVEAIISNNASNALDSFDMLLYFSGGIDTSSVQILSQPANTDWYFETNNVHTAQTYALDHISLPPMTSTSLVLNVTATSEVPFEVGIYLIPFVQSAQQQDIVAVLAKPEPSDSVDIVPYDPETDPKFIFGHQQYQGLQGTSTDLVKYVEFEVYVDPPMATGVTVRTPLGNDIWLEDTNDGGIAGWSYGYEIEGTNHVDLSLYPTGIYTVTVYDSLGQQHTNEYDCTIPWPSDMPQMTSPTPGATILSTDRTMNWVPPSDTTTVKYVSVEGYSLSTDTELFEGEYEAPQAYTQSMYLAESVLPVGTVEYALTFANFDDSLDNVSVMVLGDEEVSYFVRGRVQGFDVNVVASDSAPQSPTNLQPSGGASLINRVPRLEWDDPLGNAAWFRVYLANTATGKVLDEWTQAEQYQIATALPFGDYRWWVYSWNEHGGGGWSQAATFTIIPLLPGATTPIGPTGTQALGTRRPEFSWQSSSNATWYHVWVSRAGGKYVATWVQAPTTNWTPNVDFRSGDYRWWVAGWNSDGYGPWTTGTDFTIPAMQPEAIAQLSPEGAQVSNDLEFRWTKDARATWYRLWVSRPNGGTWHNKWYAMTGTGEGTATASNHPGGSSTWWMQPWGPDGYGPWSGPMAFSTPDPAPAVPTLVSPVGQTTSPVTLQYESERAEWYRVYVTHNGAKIIDQWTQNATLDLGARPTGGYAWWVAAWNAVSGRTVWSGRGDFTIP